MPLWRGEHVEVRQLVDDFGRYLYLPRLGGPQVLMRAIQDGVAQLTWATDAFALGESYDESAGRYRGLRGGRTVEVLPESAELLVKPEVARRQLDAETAPAEPAPGPVPAPGGGEDSQAGEEPTQQPPPSPEKKARRYHGTVTLDNARVGRDAGQIAEEVVAHLAGLVGAQVTVTLEIDAEIPEGAPDHVVRTVTENSRTLKFENHEFEES